MISLSNICCVNKLVIQGGYFIVSIASVHLLLLGAQCELATVTCSCSTLTGENICSF